MCILAVLAHLSPPLSSSLTQFDQKKVLISIRDGHKIPVQGLVHESDGDQTKLQEKKNLCLNGTSLGNCQVSLASSGSDMNVSLLGDDRLSLTMCPFYQEII